MNADDQARGDRVEVPPIWDGPGVHVREFRPPETSNRKLFGLLLVIAAVVLTVFVAVGAIVGTVMMAARSAVVAAGEAEAQQLKEQQERERVRTLARLEFEAKRQEALRRAAEAENQRRADAARALAEQRPGAQARALTAQGEAEAARRKAAEGHDAFMRAIEDRLQHARVGEEFRGTTYSWTEAIAGGTADDLLFPYGTERGEGLSWRVHLLPSIGQQDLYERFHFDEPWDSEHNLTLLPEIPPFYYHASDKPGHTRFRSFLRLDGQAGQRTKIGDVVDGLANTALIFKVGSSKSVPWTRPDSLDTAPQALTREDLGLDEQQQLEFLWCGSQRTWSTLPLNSPALAALATPAGGELYLRDAPGPPELLAPRKSTTPLLANREDEFREAERRMAVIAGGIRKVLEQAGADPQLAARLPGSQLSWRVHILPYIGQEELYRRFRLDRGWDDPANLELIAAIPEIFQFQTTPGRTRFRMFNTPQPPDRGGGGLPPLSWLIDSWETTTLAYYAAPHLAAIWTRPDNNETLLPDKPQFSMDWNTESPIIAGTADGAALRLPHDLHISKWHAFLSWRGKDEFDVAQALKFPSRPIERAYRLKPATPIAGDLPLPALQAPAPKANETPAVEGEDLAKLKKIGYAIHAYQDRMHRAPTQVSTSTGGRSGLSWRVHLLPFLGQEALYQKFRLDEAWDSQANIELLKLLPDCYRGSESTDDATPFCIFSGAQSLMRDRYWLRGADGVQHTAMLVQVPPALAVPWTKPQDIEVTANMTAADLAIGGVVRLAMGDGSVRQLSAKLPDPVFRALLTRDGGELVDVDSVSRVSAFLRGEPLVTQLASDRWEATQLKRIVVGMQNYDRAFRILPPARNAQSPTPEIESCTLSWRVHILPFIGYEQLFKQFRLDEPWDSPHNKQLLHLMPDCYRAIDDPTNSETTRVMVFTGPTTIFPELGKSMRLSRIGDGIANTILLFQAPDQFQVPWTQPSDFELELPSLEALAKLKDPKGLKIGLCDGSILTLPPEIQPETLQALITPQGGEVVSADEYRP